MGIVRWFIPKSKIHARSPSNTYLHIQFSANERVRRVRASVHRIAAATIVGAKLIQSSIYAYEREKQKKNLTHILVRCGLELQFHVQFRKAKRNVQTTIAVWMAHAENGK